LCDLLDEADEFCRAGDRLLTLAAEPELVAFRHWYLGEFWKQVEGAEPVSWPDFQASQVGMLMDAATSAHLHSTGPTGPAPPPSVEVDERAEEIERLTEVLSVAATIAGELDLDRVCKPSPTLRRRCPVRSSARSSTTP
jgi:hypothetical protein